MLSSTGSIFFRPRDQKIHADKAKNNFFRTGGDFISFMYVY